MRLSKSDFFTTIVGLTIISILGYLLYADITSSSGPGNTKRIGKITAKRNVAERKYSSRVVWDEVFKDSKLYNYDTVRTADQSEAIIRLDDGTEIALSENSMILLSISEKEVDIKFIQGTINANQNAALGKAQKVNIVSGDSKVSLKNGDISLSQDRNDRLQMTVNRGKATLKTGKEEKIINEKQNIVAGKDSIRLYDLTIRLISPENNRYIESSAKENMVNFSWETPKGEYTASLEIAKNPAVSDPFIKNKVNGNASAIGLQEGLYYWRVSAVNKATGKVESSEIRKVTIYNNKPVILISPANNSTIKFRDQNPMINFIWSKNESVSRYTLLISQKSDMTAPAVKSVVDGNKISLNNLGQGTYFWKIMNINENDQVTKSVESPIYTFSVLKTSKMEPPKPVYPTEDKSIHPLSIVQKGLTFNWTKDSSIKETQITIAEDRELSKPVYTKKIGENFTRFTGKLVEGNYFWGLKGIMKDGTSTDSSSVRRFKVVQGGAISLVEPQNGALIINKNTVKGTDIDFSWSKSELEGKYRLQVANNRNFKPVMKEVSVDDSSKNLPDMTEGRYFWRVALVDEKGVEILTSQTNSFELMSLLDAPVAIAPLAGSSIDMLKKDTLNFAWKPVKGANLYRIGLFHAIGGIQHSVATLETRNTAYEFADLKKLDVGKFLWTLQAIDIDPAANRIKRKSEEIKTVFEIKLGIKGDLKLNTPNIINSE
jgi:hypothetical protein